MADPTDVFRLKITLRGSRPSIWRRLEVPSNVTLATLHRVLQVAMGWTDMHLHQFRAGDIAYGPLDPEIGAEQRNERITCLHEVLRSPKDRLVYEYDFGDGWEHDIVLEQIGPPEAGKSYPVCVGGRRARPPEDCGGITGHADLLEALSDPNHPEHSEMREWVGSEFDPEVFSVEEVNQLLRRGIRRRSA